MTWKEYLLNEPVVFEKYSIVFAVSFLMNLLVFPAMAFQMLKTYKRKEAKSFNPYFIALQLFGGAPEGMAGAVIGFLNGNSQTMAVGLYAMLYNMFMLYFRLFQK